VGSPQSVAKSCDWAKGIVKPIKGDLIGRAFGMNTKIPNIEVIRSLWRRVKKGVKVRDLKPVKDVKGGSGLTGESKPITGGTGTADTTSTWRYVPKKRRNPKRGAEDWFVPCLGLGSRGRVYTVWSNHFTTL
jgi:hypothetical protein